MKTGFKHYMFVWGNKGGRSKGTGGDIQRKKYKGEHFWMNLTNLAPS